MDLRAVAGRVGVVEVLRRKFWGLRTFDCLCGC
jgi:hypothetical protein